MVRSGVVRCLLAAVLFGASAPAASRLARDMAAPTLAGLLYLGAAAAVVPAVLRRPPRLVPLRSGWGPVAVAVVTGGLVGPLLLVEGLARIDAATASILLNLELAATVVLATTLFREHLGRRVAVGAGLVTSAGALLVWEPGLEPSLGALLIVGACACWGLDNCVTARIDGLAPEVVVAAKGLVAGSVNVALGLAVVSGGTSGFTPASVAAALFVGAGGYGLSITLWVKGARDLGAARGQVIFATGPFIGALIAWMALGDPVTSVQVAAAVLAALGVALSLNSAHEHLHAHDPVDHDHDHEHTHPDPHHAHQHASGFAGRHSHPHRHEEVLVHAHTHLPDLHHRHVHDRA